MAQMEGNKTGTVPLGWKIGFREQNNTYGRFLITCKDESLPVLAVPEV